MKKKSARAKRLKVLDQAVKLKRHNEYLKQELEIQTAKLNSLMHLLNTQQSTGLEETTSLECTELTSSAEPITEGIEESQDS